MAVAKYRVKKWGQWRDHTITIGQELNPAQLEKLAAPEVRAIWFAGREPAIVGLTAEGMEVLLDAKGQPRDPLPVQAPAPK